MNHAPADIAASTPAHSSWPRLCHLPGMARIGVAALMLVVLGGLLVSAWHLFDHYQNRDETMSSVANRRVHEGVSGGST